MCGSVFAEAGQALQVLHADLAALISDQRLQGDEARVAAGAWEPLAVCLHSRAADLFVLRRETDENHAAGLSVVAGGVVSWVLRGWQKEIGRASCRESVCQYV